MSEFFGERPAVYGFDGHDVALRLRGDVAHTPEHLEVGEFDSKFFFHVGSHELNKNIFSRDFFVEFTK